MADTNIFNQAAQGDYSGVAGLTTPIQPSSNSTGSGIQNASAIVEVLKQLLNQTTQQGLTRTGPANITPTQLPVGQNKPADFSHSYVPPGSPNSRKINSRTQLLQNLSNLVAKVENQHEQKKARDIAYDMQRIMTAMQNPTPENQDLVNEILSDPKKRKEIAKAMNIQFLGEDKRKPYQKQAVQIFQQLNKPQNGQQNQGQPGQQPNQSQQIQRPNYFQQLQRQQPQVQQLSPEAQINATAIKLGLAPDANKKLDMIKSFMTDQTKLDLMSQRIGLEQTKMLAQAALKAADIQQKTNHDDVIKQIAAAKDTTSLMAAYTKANAEITAAATRTGAEDRRTQAIVQNTQETNATRKYVATIPQQTKALSGQLTDATKVLTNSNSTSAERKKAEQTIQDVQKKLDDLSSGASKITGIGDTNSNGSGNKSGDTGSSSGQPNAEFLKSFSNILAGFDADEDEDKE